MASKEQSVTLLRRNKRAQVEALNSLGFNLTEGARAADFPMFIKWGAGLLDVTVAANRKSDNKNSSSQSRNGSRCQQQSKGCSCCEVCVSALVGHRLSSLRIQS